VQREAFFAYKLRVTIFDCAVSPETMANNCNQLAMVDTDGILQKGSIDTVFEDNCKPFGDRDACKKIAEILRTIKP
jgi:UDP-N-acetylglucosamine 2-epimerase